MGRDRPAMSGPAVDPELRPALEGYLSSGMSYDEEGVRAMREGLSAFFAAAPPARPASVLVEDVVVPGPDNGQVPLRIYRPAAQAFDLPALYWMHGGGMVIGSVDMDDALLVGAVERLGLAVVSVEYRLAPDHPDPAPVEDCYSGLAWTAAHGAEHGIDPDRLAVGGASAGGGLAAGTALLARDRHGPDIAFQLLLEPMLDDRAVTSSSTAYKRSVVWDRQDNEHGWSALLGDRKGTDAVSCYAAPARATDLGGLPPAFVDVGEIETFRDECIDYARRLMISGVPTELHVYPGAFHGFDLMVPDARVTRTAWNLRWSALARALALDPPGEPGA
jgi:acetyl esterase/lipase